MTRNRQTLQETTSSTERLEDGLKIEWGGGGGRMEAGKKCQRRGGKIKMQEKGAN